jgi:nitroreductase
MHDQTEIFKEIVAKRRSLRAFQSRPVAAEIMESVFTAAMKAPSNCNTQPWLVHVASGQSIEALRKEMPKRFMAGEMSMDFPYDGAYSGVYKERQYGSAQALYDSMDITRADKELRQAAFMRNFSFFDAPHVAFLFLPEPFGLREACDMGMFAQTLMLSLTAHGLGSCPQTALSFQVDLVREQLGVDASNKLVFGISFGYPDPDAPVNRCATDRAALADIVTFHS